MALYRLRYTVKPPAPFGLPDGDKIVVPAGAVEVHGPVLDSRSGVLVGHGSMPVYRSDAERLNVASTINDSGIEVTDDFLTISIQAETADQAYAKGSELADLVAQSLSAQSGMLFSLGFLFVEDERGAPCTPPRPKSVRLMNLTAYNLKELGSKVLEAFSWAHIVDERAKKALLYFESACLLQEYAGAQDQFARHAAFSRALAFLQLFKGVTTLLGDPSTNRDYQRRFRELGLPPDFWFARVQPLYKVRNDKDVAHYSLGPPDSGAFLVEFGNAAAVFKDAMSAYIRTLESQGADA